MTKAVGIQKWLAAAGAAVSLLAVALALAPGAGARASGRICRRRRRLRDAQRGSRSWFARSRARAPLAWRCSRSSAPTSVLSSCLHSRRPRTRRARPPGTGSACRAARTAGPDGYARRRSRSGPCTSASSSTEARGDSSSGTATGSSAPARSPSAHAARRRRSACSTSRTSSIRPSTPTGRSSAPTPSRRARTRSSRTGPAAASSASTEHPGRGFSGRACRTAACASTTDDITFLRSRVPLGTPVKIVR